MKYDFGGVWVWTHIKLSDSLVLTRACIFLELKEIMFKV